MMKKIGGFLALAFFMGISAFAQTRSDILIYIPPVVSVNPEQVDYFQDSFAVETVGAGYTLATDITEADYSLELNVSPNMIMYDDGTEEPAPPGEKQFRLSITLTRCEDEAEVVAFSFPFTDVDEMTDFNLYLLYEALANVPLTKLGDIPIIYNDDWWRNKWLYVRASFDYPITFYGLQPQGKYQNALWADPEPVQGGLYKELDNKISPWLAASLGLEFQYLGWMSTELDFNLSFGDPMSNAFIATLQVEQKFPIKPNAAKNYMIEPYGVVAFPTNTSPNSSSFPTLGAGGGLQLGMRGGLMGALFVDVNFIYYFGDVVVKNTDNIYTNPGSIKYNRYVLGLGLGYKIGFVNRPEVKRR